MFSADDLLNRGGTRYVAYNGYDHTGKKVKGNPTLDDFFTTKDENGNYKRAIGAYQPIYIAGYIQDRFDFKDLKFNVGLRIDRFDANQKVLKDKYLLYETKTAKEVSTINNNSVTHPSNIGQDYVVYVNDSYNPTAIVGYREGDNWYNATGTLVSDPLVSLGGTNTTDGTVNPYLVDPIGRKNKNITANVFEDYDPQINFMPRIAFAFPISDVANFFAHYDVLTQRPRTASRLDPFQYMNMESDPTAFINNPNLKTEKTIDYELGFTQVLNEKKNSAITISTYYRELRNMIQAVRVNQAYPNSYTSFDNIDFGTVKGFSIAYDLRRLSNGVQLTANYTLQFADGTGSSASDGLNLANSGQPNLRTTHPVDYDQRHTIVLNVDYRFGSSKNYKGPVWNRKKGTDNEKAIKLFENVGANILIRAGSGTPYSRNAVISSIINPKNQLLGDINGSNLPWNFKVDLRVDKNIELTWGKDGEDKKHAGLNVYVQVLNLLNTKNILAVYAATGNPDDDGYLASPGAQADINVQTNPQSYMDMYSIYLRNPFVYSMPRVIRLGALLNF